MTIRCFLYLILFEFFYLESQYIVCISVVLASIIVTTNLRCKNTQKNLIVTKFLSTLCAFPNEDGINVIADSSSHHFIVTLRQFAVTVMGVVFTVIVLALPPV